MKRMLFALAVAGMAAAGTARADWNGYAPPTGGGGYPVPSGGGEFTAPNTLSGAVVANAHKTPDRYGLLPGLRKVFHIEPTCDACGIKGGHRVGCAKGGCNGCGGGGYGGYDPNAAAGPQMMQGTLVFPHHTFVRSPRDYFMYEPGR